MTLSPTRRGLSMRNLGGGARMLLPYQPLVIQYVVFIRKIKIP